MSHANASNSALNHDLLKQAQAHLEKAAAPWSPPGSVPAVSYNTGIGSAPQAVAAKPPVATQSGPKPQTSGSMANNALQSVLARGGGNGFKLPSGVPAVSYNTGFGAPAEPVAARPPVATQSGPKPSFMDINLGPSAAKPPMTQTRPAKPVNATPAAMQQQEMNPSDQAKAIFAQVNQRRRDAAFGRGAFSAADEKAMMDQGNKLLNQSNTMRNAPGYKPDVKSMHPRDQADRLRIQLNQQRSAAGGEVAQAPQVMRRLNQFNAAADAMPAPKMPGNMMIPGRPSPRPTGPTPMQRPATPEPMFAKRSMADLTPYAFGGAVKKAFLGPGLVGAGLGALTSPEGHRSEGAYRGAAKGTGTGLGALAGMPLGVLATAMLLKGRGRKIPLRATSGPMRGARPFTQNQANRQNLGRALVALGIGAPVGGVAGGAAGYGATSAALGKPSWDQAK